MISWARRHVKKNGSQKGTTHIHDLDGFVAISSSGKKQPSNVDIVGLGFFVYEKTLGDLVVSDSRDPLDHHQEEHYTKATLVKVAEESLLP